MYSICLAAVSHDQGAGVLYGPLVECANNNRPFPCMGCCCFMEEFPTLV